MQKLTLSQASQILDQEGEILASKFDAAFATLTAFLAYQGVKHKGTLNSALKEFNKFCAKNKAHFPWWEWTA